ncbi:MAG TPA: TetR/AcrR family transcriptional regulator, partial [Nannocystis sp.]
AGLSKGGVYFHFKAKEALFHDILDAQLQELQNRWAVNLPPDLPADRVLAQVARNHLQLFQDHPDEARLCNLLVTMAGQVQEYRDKLEKTFSEMRGCYAEIVRRGVAEGVLSGDPQVVARGIIAVIYGLAAQASVDPEGRIPLGIDEALGHIMRLAGASS